MPPLTTKYHPSLTYQFSVGEYGATLSVFNVPADEFESLLSREGAKVYSEGAVRFEGVLPGLLAAIYFRES